MKTTAVLFALFMVGVIPAYSQLNRHHNIERRPIQFLKKADKDSVFGQYNFPDNANDSWHAWTPYDLKISPAESTPGKSTGHTHSRDLMPLLKPEGVFHMRLFQPEGKFFMKVYLLDW